MLHPPTPRTPPHAAWSGAAARLDPGLHHSAPHSLIACHPLNLGYLSPKSVLRGAAGRRTEMQQVKPILVPPGMQLGVQGPL